MSRFSAGNSAGDNRGTDTLRELLTKYIGLKNKGSEVLGLD
jgi:hypothetical protein